MTAPQPETVNFYSIVPVPPRTSSALADAMTSKTPDANVQRRWGIVSAINTDRTVNVVVGGVEVPSLRYMATYVPSVGERVMLDVVGTDLTVLGATAPSPRNFNRPTGDIEITLRKTPKPDTLFLQGQTLNRADYPALFAWIVQQNLLTTTALPNNLFGAGDGSTTFVLPDLRGRVPMGSDATTPVGTSLGQNLRTLTADQIPSHNHDVTIDAGGAHTHAVNLTTNASGTHPGHSDYPNAIASNAGGGAGWTFPTSYNVSRGAHTHAVTGSTETGDPHTHTITQKPIGGDTPVDMRQASYTVNYLIWV